MVFDYIYQVYFFNIVLFLDGLDFTSIVFFFFFTLNVNPFISTNRMLQSNLTDNIC